MGLPSIEVIMRIASKLKTSVDYLLFKNDDNIVNATIQDRELLEVFSIFDRMKKKDIESLIFISETELYKFSDFI